MFFPHGVHFGPTKGAQRTPARDTMAFAPTLDRYGVSLDEIRASLEWYHPEPWFAAHDVRLFPGMTRAVVDGIAFGSYIGPPEHIFADDNFGRYREWLLRSGRV